MGRQLVVVKLFMLSLNQLQARYARDDGHNALRSLTAHCHHRQVCWVLLTSIESTHLSTYRFRLSFHLASLIAHRECSNTS